MKAGFEQRLKRALASLPAGIQLPAGAPGVILGSGLNSLVDRINGREIPYDKIQEFPTPTVAGHRGLLKIGKDIALLSGRFHYFEGHEPDDVVLPVFLLHGLGVRTLIVTNAAGGINPDYHPGDLVLIRDHVNLMGVNPLRGPNPPELGPRFPDMTEAYSPRLRRLALQAGGPGLREGVYAGWGGPSYETPAEIRMMRAIGADLAGMSTVPEVIAARFLGMEVLGISCVTNLAAGISPNPLNHEEVIRVGKQAAGRLEKLILDLLRILPSA